MLGKIAVLTLTVGIALLSAFASTIGVSLIYDWYLTSYGYGQVLSSQILDRYFPYVLTAFFVIYIVFLRLIIAERFKFSIESD